MWSARPEGWLSRSFRVEERGRLVGRVQFGTWSERGSIEVRGRHYPILGEGFWRRSFVLKHPHGKAAERLALARPAGTFRSGFLIEHDGVEHSLHRRSLFGSAYVLTRGERELGSVRPVGFLQRAMDVELDDELPPELCLFVFWLVALSHRRAAAAA